MNRFVVMMMMQGVTMFFLVYVSNYTVNEGGGVTVVEATGTAVQTRYFYNKTINKYSVQGFIACSRKVMLVAKLS